MENITGLKGQSNIEIAEKLNQLLANYEVYYQNLRGFHWNIKGNDFFVLHEKFEELYNAAQLSIDEVAERILTLGEQPMHTYTDFVKASSIKEYKDLSDSKSTVEALLEGLRILIALEREILSLAGEANDEGTLALMSEYLSTQEKTVWMFASFLNN
ncbi:MAG: Dps family protein [Vicingaceae bacterium]